MFEYIGIVAILIAAGVVYWCMKNEDKVEKIFEIIKG